MKGTGWMAVGVTLLVAACGGTSVVDGGNEGSGTGGTTTTSSTTTSSTTNSTTGTGGCDDHQDCHGGLCIFATGQCATGCDGFCDSCGVGAVCNDCATSSCPMCADCVAACVPIEMGQCDDDDPCDNGEVCLFDMRQCTPACGAGSGECADPNMYCDPCATGSCCGCKNCVPACLPG